MNKLTSIYFKYGASKFMDVNSIVIPLKFLFSKKIEIKIIILDMKFNTHVSNSLMTFRMEKHILHLLMEIVFFHLWKYNISLRNGEKNLFQQVQTTSNIKVL
jgi:hypothetical protein